MNCQNAQILISAYLDRELDSDEKRELRKHLISCSDCNCEYESYIRLKNCLENVHPVLLQCDTFQILKNRIANDERVAFTAPSHFVLFRRVSLVATCSLLFLLTALALFPTDSGTTSNLASASRNYNGYTATPVSSIDQNLSIDQSVTVYQASSILP